MSNGVSGWGETCAELVGRSLAAVVLIPPIPLPAMELAYAGFQSFLVAMTPMSDLLQLPQNQRLALAIALWDSLDEEAREEAMPLDSALCAELDRRWTAHLANPGAAVPWDEVRSQLGLG